MAEARVNIETATALFEFARTWCRTEEDVDDLAFAFVELGSRLH